MCFMLSKAVCLCVCLYVNQGGTNHSRYTCIETCNYASTDQLMNSDHRQKVGQFDLVYWVYRSSCLYIAVLPAQGQPMDCLFVSLLLMQFWRSKVKYIFSVYWV